MLSLCAFVTVNGFHRLVCIPVSGAADFESGMKSEISLEDAGLVDALYILDILAVRVEITSLPSVLLTVSHTSSQFSELECVSRNL